MTCQEIPTADEPVIRPLHLLTTDILLADLISGRTIATDQLSQLRLASAESRSVLNWYRRNRTKWSGNLQAADCEAIIDCLSEAPPALTAPTIASTTSSKLLRLTKVVAHRFAGLHAYGAQDDAPELFSLEFDKHITLFEGWNGSGKTSLANAIIWCLTGQLLRPQRLPEKGAEEFACFVDREDETTTAHLITPVTPLPVGTTWVPDAAAKVIPIDTWVELTFADAAGSALPPIRRTQSRKSNGKLVETPPALDSLGVDPIAFRLGTSMPGMLPFLQVGSASELGLAVARLTGLSELVDLAKHTSKAKDRISGAIAKDRRGQLDELDRLYNQERADLQKRIAEFPAMDPSTPLALATDLNAAAKIEALKTHFERLKAKGLADAKEVLGDGFDAENAQHREDLERFIGPAIDQLMRIGTLPSVERLSALKLEAGELQKSIQVIDSLHQEAAMLAELAANPTLARRTQLYARVAAWMTEHEQIDDQNCAICRSSLDGLIDRETGTLVVHHINSAQEHSDIVSKSISQWAESWTGALARDLPTSLRSELNKDLPETPVELLRFGLVEDLFATEAFTGTLMVLRPSLEAMAARELGRLPEFVQSPIKELPPLLKPSTQNLAKMLARIHRLLAFVEWLESHRSALRDALTAIRRGPATVEPSDEAIGSKLDKLSLIVRGVAPISAAIELTKRMATNLSERSKKAERITAGETASRALAEITPIGDLAQAQVDSLRARLHDRSEYWREQIYKGATSFAPTPRRTGMDAKGIIEIHVGRDCVRAPAQHVANASALRASLMGFYLAFREHVLESNGGLLLLVLDDPQDLLDTDNRQRLAKAMTLLAADGAQIVATTHDRRFARMLVAEARSGDLAQHRSIHPVNASRRTMETSLAVEDLDRKRALFVNNIDAANYAQDYANEARIFLEARLGDLFDDPAYPAYSTTVRAPTLIPLFDRLRSLVGSRSNELFKSPIVQRFCADTGMADGADARRVLNASHHDKGSISYQDVARIDNDLRRLRADIEKVHEEFRRYRWREPLSEAEETSNVVPLRPARVPAFDVEVCQDIAAFTGSLPSGGSQDDTREVFSSSWLDDKALFYIRHDTMGFAIPAGSVAIVQTEPSAGRDHNLVIARRGTQIYARRLLRPRNGEGLSLAAEMPDPRKSRPTLTFEQSSVEIRRVVGALFSRLPPPEGREEAAEIESVPDLSRIRAAYRVREESAVPLALPGQTVLGGKQLFANDLDSLEGELIAVTLNDGTSIFKRVGARLPGTLAHLRQFETIGGLGDSVVIATEDIEGGPDLPVMQFARRVVGVIYDL